MFRLGFFAFLFVLLQFSYCLAEDPLSNIESFQAVLRERPLNERIAFWAEAFLGKPYDTDPLGDYVRKRVIVADGSADCMYHTFRSVELAISSSPEEAVREALTIRFFTKGILEEGKVINYENRYQYGEDMIDSGKWGKEITAELGRIIEIKGSRGKDRVVILPREESIKKDALHKFRNGDIIYFIKDPDKRVVEEIVGHIGIIKVKSNIPYLIHASGIKDSNIKGGALHHTVHGGGSVKEAVLSDYLKDMKFIGIRATRF